MCSGKNKSRSDLNGDQDLQYYFAWYVSKYISMYINHKGSKLVWIDKKELRDIILNTYLEVKIDQNVPQKIKLDKKTCRLF